MAETIEEDPGLSDRVNHLLQAHADHIDRGDCAGVASLFAEEGRWEHAVGVVLVGRPAILRHLQEGIGQFAQSHHHVGPALWLRQPDGSVQSTAYFIATHVLQGGHTYTVWGRYLDHIAAEGTHLLITLRQTVVHLTEGTDREYRMLQRVPLHD